VSIFGAWPSSTGIDGIDSSRAAFERGGCARTDIAHLCDIPRARRMRIKERREFFFDEAARRRAYSPGHEGLNFTRRYCSRAGFIQTSHARSGSRPVTGCDRKPRALRGRRAFCGQALGRRNCKVEVDAFVDGHDKISVALRYRAGGEDMWREVDMSPLVSDRWMGEFAVHAVGWQEITVAAWVDRFATWRYDLQKRVNAGQDVRVDLLIGAQLVEEAAAINDGEIAASLGAYARFLRSDHPGQATEVGLDAGLATMMRRHGPAGVRDGVADAVAHLGRPIQSAVQQLVRVLPALRVARPEPARHAARRREPPRFGRPHGLRRALPPAGPPDRSRLSQGAQ
jgi:hypothetical protein